MENNLTVDPSELSFDEMVGLNTTIPEVKQEVPVEAPVEQPAPVAENSHKELSDYALSALVLKEEGFLNVDDVPKDLNLEGLVTALKDSRVKESEYLKDTLLREAGEFRNLMELKILGVDQSTIDDVVSTTGYHRLKVSLSPEESDNEQLVSQIGANRERIIEAELKYKGISDKEIPIYMEAYKNKGMMEEKATSSQEFFKGEETRISAAIKEQELQNQEYLFSQQAIVEKQFEDILNSKKIGGYSLNDSESKELKSFINDMNTVVTYKDNKGNPVSQKITGFAKKIEEFKSSPESQLAFALWLMKDNSFAAMKDQGKVEQHNSIFNEIKSRSSSKSVEKEDVKESKDDDILRSILYGQYTG